MLVRKIYILVLSLLCCGLTLAMPDTTAERSNSKNPVKITGKRDISSKDYVSEISLISKFPIDDADAISNYWYSLNQATEILVRPKISDGILYRALKIGLMGYVSEFSEYYAHELGHDRIGKLYGDIKYSLDLTNWRRGYPEWVHTMQQNNITTKMIVAATVAGPNQDELNASWVIDRTNEHMSIGQGLNYLPNKFKNLLYNIAFRDYIPDSFGPQGDIRTYVDWMRQIGYERYFFKSHLQQAFITTMLSSRTWDALRSVYYYSLYGIPNIEVIRIEAGDWVIIPPQLGLFLTTKGTFYSINTRMTYRDVTFNLNYGTDVDSIWGGEVHTSRIGGKIESLPFYHFAFSPYAYLDFSNDGSNNYGYTIGVESQLGLFDERLQLGLKCEFNKDDIIENIVKTKENGFYFYAYMGYRFKQKLIK